MFAIVVKLPIFEPPTAAQFVCIWLTTGRMSPVHPPYSESYVQYVPLLHSLREIVAGMNTREERKIVLRDLAGAVGHERRRYIISDGAKFAQYS